ncbi:uncharacterized protein LOC120180072 [Hibiscus syriacus]|uniref:uncharacterized protein LOC120180072 n=1 Tax=Hibiscus syriacus TaxID=106335 RepID=UPI0019218406|nr:uncharacterized protein LOC120180072 [Hibiscus syriacus]
MITPTAPPFGLKSQPSSSSPFWVKISTFFIIFFLLSYLSHYLQPTVQNQAGSYQSEPQEFQDQAKIYVPDDGQLKLSTWKKEERGESVDHHHEDSSYMWMPSKMRILRKRMLGFIKKLDEIRRGEGFGSISPHHLRITAASLPIITTTTNCADCNTTKTPLWRSGPRGPKIKSAAEKSISLPTAKSFGSSIFVAITLVHLFSFL